MVKRSGKIALGGVLLAGVGYLAGILTAPKSGKETRKDIQKTMARAKSEAEKNLKSLHAELGDLVEQGKKTAKTASASAKKEVQKAVDMGQNARDMAKNVLSAIHEGESDDKDLQKALTEANKAINHLKKYAGKNVKTKKA